MLWAGGVCTVVMLGIIGVAWAEEFPEGVVTTGIRITPDAGEGEGEGEGEVEANTLAFEASDSEVRFENDYGKVEFLGDNSEVQFLGEDSSIEFLNFGLVWFWDSGIVGAGSPFAPLAMLIECPAEMWLDDMIADYFAGLTSAGVAMVMGPSGMLYTGTSLVNVGEGEGEGEGELWVERYGAALLATNEDGVERALIHADPTNGLPQADPPPEEPPPSAEMSVLALDGTPTASVVLVGNDSEGEVLIYNKSRAAIYLDADGNVVVNLGGEGEGEGEDEGEGGGGMDEQPARFDPNRRVPFPRNKLLHDIVGP